MRPQRSVGLGKKRNCYQQNHFSATRDEKGVKHFRQCLSSTSRAFRSQNCCFSTCFVFVSFFSSPGALGRSIKACPTPSSSILSSCLPLLCEAGKSQFLLPLVSSDGRTVCVERAACILPPLSLVNGLGCEAGHQSVSLPAMVLSKAQDVWPALYGTTGHFLHHPQFSSAPFA